MKKIRIRHTNGTDLTRLFSAKIPGGSRGFDDNTLALETFSNDFTPTIKCLQGFTLIVEVEDEQTSDKADVGVSQQGRERSVDD